MREIWKYLKHFSPNEKNHEGKSAWGDSNKVDGLLLRVAEKIRIKAGLPMVVHCAYDLSGHASDSEHFRGGAIDFHITGMDKDYKKLYQAYQIIMQVLKEMHLEEYAGLGIYLDWSNLGFHLDLRGYRARWSRIKGNYVNIDQAISLISK